MSDAAWNLMMAAKYPNWHEHLDSVRAALAEEDRVYEARFKAGWELDEGGWFTPDGTHESEYDGPLPEDDGTE